MFPIIWAILFIKWKRFYRQRSQQYIVVDGQQSNNLTVLKQTW